MNCIKTLIYIMMMGITIEKVVADEATVAIHSTMILLMLVCSCDIKTNMFRQANAAAVL